MSALKVIRHDPCGVVLVEPVIFEDARGSFAETFSERDFAAAMASLGVSAPRFVQDNESRSMYGVVRGLHFQREPHAQAKLVRVTAGAIRDVVVDLRRSSPTFGRWKAFELSATNRLQLFIPRGFAHGFSVQSPEGATVAYKCDDYYDPASEGGIVWNDPSLAIDWGVSPSVAIVSQRDMAWPTLAEAYIFDL